MKDNNTNQYFWFCRILGFKDFESARRTIAGIEIVHMIKKEQLNTQEQSMFKSFNSLAA